MDNGKGSYTVLLRTSLARRRKGLTCWPGQERQRIAKEETRDQGDTE